MGHHHHHGHSHGDHNNEVYSKADQRLLRLVTFASVGVASVLVILKTFAWQHTDALSLLSSLVDSLMDVMISVVNFIAIRYALKPADSDHRHGHNSIEDIAGLVQFTFIAASAGFVIFHSIDRLIHPITIHHSETGITVMGISLVATTALVLFQRMVYRRTQSAIVAADSLHYLGDVLMNASIIVALIVAPLMGWDWLDPLLAILVSFYIAHHAIEIGQRSYNNLMDKEMPEEDKARIVAIIEAQEGLKGFHALKTRYSGSKPFIQMHLELDGAQSLNEAHAIADALEHALKEAFPGADVICHEDPV